MAVRVQREDFDIAAEVARADRRAHRHRRHRHLHGPRARRRGPLAAMTLEHYPGMTEAELARIEAEAQARWPLQASLIVHRVGELAPGDNIVLVVTAVRASPGGLRGRGLPDGLPQDAGAVLEKGNLGRRARAPGSRRARATKAPPGAGR